MASTEQSAPQVANAPVESIANNPAQQPAVTLMALGLIGWGTLALIYHDFGLVWQPVPASIPAHAFFANAVGTFEVALGAGLFFGATRVWAVRILLPFLIAWQMLKLPALFAAPSTEGVWLGYGELAMLLAGGWTLFARLADLGPGSLFSFATGERSVRLARYYFAAWIIPIGLSHLVYLAATRDLVPSWLPFRTGWAYLTGVGQIASGLGILLGVLPRVAAWAEAGQIWSYTMLIWLPAVLGPASKDLEAVFGAGDYRRTCWTAFFISWVIASGAWATAQNVPGRQRIDTRQEP